MKNKRHVFVLMVLVLFCGILLAGCNPQPQSNAFSISVVKIGEGDVDVVSTAESGETVNVDVQASDGYDLGGIYVNNQILTQSTFVMPQENVTLFVYFTQNQSSEQERINLKQGAYVARAYGKTDYNSAWLDEWSTYTIALNMKANNQFDLYGCVANDTVYEITDQVYTRNGNKITSAWQSMQFDCTILDENTILYFSKDNDVVVFCYQEQKTIPEGTYTATLDEGEAQITISGDDVSVTLPFEQQPRQMKYKIVGDRLYITEVDNDVKYVAIIQDCYSQHFYLTKFGTKIEESWQILYEGVSWTKI